MIKTREGRKGEWGDSSVGEPLLYKQENLTLNLQHPLKGSGCTCTYNLCAGGRGKGNGITGTCWPLAQLQIQSETLHQGIKVEADRAT